MTSKKIHVTELDDISQLNDKDLSLMNDFGHHHHHHSHEKIKMSDIKKQFKELNINTCQVLLDPWINFFILPCNFILKRCCLFDNSGSTKRARALIKSEEKLQDQLEIGTLLKKIRDAHGMLSIFKRKKYKQLIKYHDENVIDIGTTESDE